MAAYSHDLNTNTAKTSAGKEIATLCLGSSVIFWLHLGFDVCLVQPTSLCQIRGSFFFLHSVLCGHAPKTGALFQADTFRTPSKK